MPANVQVVFDAQTGQFRANVDAATQSVTKQAQAVIDAKNKIVDSLNQQLEAAKRNGASTEQLTGIQMQAAMRLANVTDTNANRIIASLDRVSAKQKQVASELQNLSQVTSVQGNDASPISNRMQASALIRAGSGTGSIRAAEAFASSIPAFNAVASIAFPIVGALAFGDAIVKGVSALHEMYETAVKLPDAVKQGWESIDAPMELSVDSLRKTNDELEITIAKLEHKPANNLALAIDEARINADRLADSADKAASEVKKMLAENHGGLGTFIMTGATSTGPVADEINKRMQDLRDLQQANRDALHTSTDTPAAAAARAAAITAKMRDNVNWASKSRSDIGTFNQGGQNNAIVNDLAGFQNQQQYTLDDQSEQARNVGDQQTQKKLTQQQEAQRIAQEGATKAREAAQKAFEQQKQQWKAQDDARIQAGNDSATVEVNTWAQRVASLKQGSQAYIDAQNQLTEKLAEARRQDTEEKRKAAEQAQRDQRTQWSQMFDSMPQQSTAGQSPSTVQGTADFWGMRSLEATPGSANQTEALNKENEAYKELAKVIAEVQQAQDKAAESQAKSLQSYNEAALAIQKQTGMISGYDYATQVANVHAQEYAANMDALQKALGGQTPGSAGATNAQAAIDKANADRAVQVMQDASAMAAQSWSGALKNANAEFVQSAQDSASQVVALYKQTVDGFNSDIANKAVTGKGNFAGTFRSLGTSLAGDGLKRVEAPILGSLGMGKPDGSRSNPIAVLVVGTTFGMGGSIIPGGSTSSIASLMSTASPAIGGTSSTSSSGGVGGFFSTLLGIGANVVGHLAVGGGVQNPGTYEVGEAGPEYLNLPAGSSVTPHSAIGANAYYTIQVANGVTPEETDMRVRAALQQAHPHIVRSSVQAMHEHQKRTPTGR